MNKIKDKEVLKEFSPTAGQFIKYVNGSYMTCCDCGLVHKMKYKIVDGEVYVRFWRNNKMTKKYREELDEKVMKEIIKHLKKNDHKSLTKLLK